MECQLLETLANLPADGSLLQELSSVLECYLLLETDIVSMLANLDKFEEEENLRQTAHFPFTTALLRATTHIKALFNNVFILL